MSVRDFKQAATLFLDTVATFTSYELMDYQTFVTYTVLSSSIALERPKLREKVSHNTYTILCSSIALERPKLREKVSHNRFVCTYPAILFSVKLTYSAILFCVKLAYSAILFSVKLTI
ncbi:hypothetical protein DPMN_118314 [Dreissena polymorpha]|uniref:26S proteasome regulatory subunit Rpn7 N-terminal domain-containing protein n=1 Tax=Dreissena polymorpha TaxID=45954 RepID=A0A9D4GJV2_DREPO|nr:hypothetical protein DPMN_118314 [Dreissena polymorpha]